MKLEHFCDADENREHLRQPFNLDDKTVSTNGHILLATPKSGDHRDYAGNNPAMIAALIETIKNAPFHLAPEIVIPEKLECSRCDGDGKGYQKPCHECEGEGVLQFHSDVNTYEVECESCEGDGFITIIGGEDDCLFCKGTGRVFRPYESVKVLGMTLQAKYLSLIVDAPNLELAALKDKHILAFRSGDHWGGIMECRI